MSRAKKVLCQCISAVSGSTKPCEQRNLDAQLAKFLRKQRGSLSYAQFSKRVGISYTTLHRIERGEHHLTLHKLETVLTKLKVRLSHVFPDEY